MDTPIYTTKHELAQAYAPGMSYNSARRRLQRWMHGNERLMEKLKSIGYDKNSQRLSIRELEIIYTYLGEP